VTTTAAGDPTTAPGASNERGSGPLAALASALCFGVSAPLAKRLLDDVPPLPLAALLYFGAGIGLAAYDAGRRLLVGRVDETPLRAADVPTLATMIVIGGVIGPLLMLIGLQRVSGVVGSLLLNLEAPLTIVLALAFFGDHLDAGAFAGSALVIAGAVLLSAVPGDTRADGVGVVALAAAALGWALDNNLTQRLSARDPVMVARVKTLGAGVLGLGLSAALGYASPSADAVGVALVVGFVGYGVSIVLAVAAMRRLGAARHAAFFATAPFIGAVTAVPLLGETFTARAALVAIVMALGLVALLRERHLHEHHHEALTHEHRHVHDEHHRHDHDGPVSEPHAHLHVHEPLTHAHPHRPDVHHRHRH